MRALVQRSFLFLSSRRGTRDAVRVRLVRTGGNVSAAPKAVGPGVDRG